MKLYDNILHFFRGGRRMYKGATAYSVGGWTGDIGTLPFADALFLNCVELLTDLCGDVCWKFDKKAVNVEVAFVRFFESYGKIVLNKIFREGVVVIGHTQRGDGPAAAHDFHICQPGEFIREEGQTFVTYKSTREGVDVCAIESPVFQMTGQSDYAVLRPFLEYVDNALNASNTISKRLGAFVVACPKNSANSPIQTILDEDEQKQLQKETQEQYGALDKQNQILILPREMAFQVISLATLDMKTNDKVKSAVLAIADRLKVPANQLAMIDASTSNSLSNGGELAEGDLSKYKSFERLIDQTFVRLAKNCGLNPGAVDVIQGETVPSYYVIYNKPAATSAQLQQA